MHPALIISDWSESTNAPCIGYIRLIREHPCRLHHHFQTCQRGLCRIGQPYLRPRKGLRRWGRRRRCPPEGLPQTGERRPVRPEAPARVSVCRCDRRSGPVHDGGVDSLSARKDIPVGRNLIARAAVFSFFNRIYFAISGKCIIFAGKSNVKSMFTVMEQKKNAKPHRPLLTEEQQKQLELISSMSYEEVNEWAKQFPTIPEGKSIMDYAQYVDMTLEEFVEAYDLIDITDRVLSRGRNMINDGTDI